MNECNSILRLRRFSDSGMVVVRLAVFALATAFSGRLAAAPPADAALEPFNVKDCTGPAAGKTLCYYCRYGRRPVVCVFARKIDDGLADVASAVDVAVQRHRDQRLAAFVVFLGADTDSSETALREIAAERKIAHVPLTIYRDTNEKLTQALGVSGDAPLTVRLWNRGRVIAQQTHDSTQLDEASLAALLDAIGKLTAGNTVAVEENP